MGLKDNLSKLSPNKFLEKMQDMFQMYQESQDNYYEEAKHLSNEQVAKYKKATAQFIRLLEKMSLQKNANEAEYGWLSTELKAPILEKIVKERRPSLSPKDLMDLTIEFVNNIGSKFLHRPLNNIN